ncbi:MAG: ABC transporter ATP-binding protein [Trueperaceae bacterium]|jgi:ATP-binding cassette subfamily B protein|nr:ABC transporter ATP-binding protein [Trueperaceae bacterium]
MSRGEDREKRGAEPPQGTGNEGKTPKVMKSTERVGGGMRGPMGGAAAVQKASNFGPSLRRLLSNLAPHRLKLGLLIAAAVMSVTLMSVGPRILGHATDLIFGGLIGKMFPAGMTKEQAIASARAAGQGKVADLLSGIDLVPGVGVDFQAVGRVLLIVMGIYVLASLLQFVQGYLLNDVVNATVFGFRRRVEEKLNRLPLRYFDAQPRGELLSRVTNDIDNVSQSLQQTLSQFLTALLTVVLVLVMMLTISPVLTLVALASIPVTMFIAILVMKRSGKQFTLQWRRTGTLNSAIEEAYTGHALVKVFGRQREVQATFEVENDALFDAAFRAQFLSGLIMPASSFIGNLNYAAVAVIGGLRVASGIISLGEVQAFIQYSRQFTQPVTQIASMINLLQSGVASAERVFELLDAEEEVSDVADKRLTPPVRGRVTFENVSFRYEPDRPLIEDLSLTAEPGRTVAIVGPTGAGKTTLVNLLMRFYELDSGRITLDGVDIATMSRAELRSKTGMVLQDTWLFKGTIRDNIAYGRPSASEEEILAAARATYVDRFVHSLPEGYDTLIDDEGGTVSTGEKQLITIARAFLADPALLILDEATSSVDTRTELLLQQAMAALRGNRTSFVIAHRLSTIVGADLILVMEQGRIVERGSHDELLKLGGNYAALYQSQFEGVEQAA